MTRLLWDSVGERIFETGVDRGVLYPPSGFGVPWNGLISVNDAPTGGEARPYYLDGIKYINESAPEEFEGTIEAFTYPDEFELCDGSAAVDEGFYARQQERLPFGLSFRTKIGNDVLSTEYAYKIHIIYNALAAPSARAYESMNDTPEAITFSWGITTTPVQLAGLRPSSHFIFDSRELPAYVLTALEDILYGSNTEASRLPDIAEILSLYDYTPGPSDGTFTANFQGSF